MTMMDEGRRDARSSASTPGLRLMLAVCCLLAAGLLGVWVGNGLAGDGDWSYGGAVRGSQAVDAGAAPVSLLIVAGVVVAVLAALSLWVYLRRGAKGHAAVGMADRVHVRELAGHEAARALARYTRRRAISAGRLDVEKCPVAEVGWDVGTSSKERVVVPYESQVGVVAPTGGGKTRYLLRGAARTACGALVITTTKLRDYTSVIADREKLGRVMVWDPLQVSKYPGLMYWDPVAGSDDPDVAFARGQAFAGGLSKSGGDDDGAAAFFADACALIMARLLLAAAVSGGTMDDVRRWAGDLQNAGQQAVEILEKKLPHAKRYAKSLAQFVFGEDKTIKSVQMTMAIKIEVIMGDRVMRALTPGPMSGLRAAQDFHPESFVRSTDTLIIVTDDNARTNVAPLSTMLLGEITDAAKAWAAEVEGPLDAPMRIVGDEIANVAPLPKLPSMLSDSRGTGIQWIIAIQSLAAIRARWGEDQADVILSNLTGLLVLGGSQDTKMLERFADLAGKYDVVEATSTLNARGDRVTSTNYARHERQVMRPEQIAHLEQGRAFMQFRNGRSLIVDLVADNGS